MIGFNLVVVLDNQGKVIDYKKAYNNSYAKKVEVFTPMRYSKTPNIAFLHTAINDTYPLVIEKAKGKQEKADLNCYCFDLTLLYNKYYDDGRIGLTNFELVNDDDEAIFVSQTFRV